MNKLRLNKIRELEIAKCVFDISKACPEPLNYFAWISFIEKFGLVWKENTVDGKNTLININAIPESFRERVLLSLNKRTACYDFDENKNQYRVLLTFRSELNYIGINIEGKLVIKDLNLLLEMAKHLDAILLKDGKEIIDEKVIESLT